MASIARPDGSKGSRPIAVDPVNTRKRRDEAAESIRMAFLSGRLVPGQHLKEVELAGALNISRPTLRESLVQLIHEGLLVEVPYKGIFVAELTAGDLRHVADVRVSLESLAASYVREDRTGSAIAVIKQALAEHSAAIDGGDEVQAYETHIAFHRSILEASGNSILLKLWPMLETHIRMAIAVDQAARHDLERDKELHTNLVKMIESGTAEDVFRTFGNHLRGSADELAHVLQTKQPETGSGSPKPEGAR
jgi:DNA-binding GntR family transcriptional regulator